MPDIDNLVNSVTVYYLGNYISEILTDFISRNDFVYYYLVGRLSEGDNSNKLIQQMICIYLSEANNFFIYMYIKSLLKKMKVLFIIFILILLF